MKIVLPRAYDIIYLIADALVISSFFFVLRVLYTPRSPILKTITVGCVYTIVARATCQGTHLCPVASGSSFPISLPLRGYQYYYAGF